MKKVLFSAAVLSVVGLSAQVGIEENDPKATLDVGGDLRVQSVPEVKTNKEDYSKCPCLLLIGNDGKLKRYGDAEALKALGINPETNSGSTPDSGDGGDGGKGKEGEKPETTQPQPSTPTVVGGTATFASLSDAEKYILSYNFGSGANEQKQGRVTSTGITVKIPYTGAEVGGTVTETEFVSKENSNLVLKIKGTEISETTGELEATLYYKGGTLDLKQFTLEEVKASNYEKVEGTFEVKVNGAAKSATVTLKALGGIPDKKFSKGRKYIYIPIEGPDGKIWLNQNLGADYANIDLDLFAPTKIGGGDNRKDKHAFGDLYQWQRGTDGHQLIGSTTTSTRATSWTANNGGRFISNAGAWNSSAKSSPDDESNKLWQKQTDNNPCPTGYRVPTKEEWEKILSLDSMLATLGLTAAGNRGYHLGPIQRREETGEYWSSTGYDRDNARSMGFNVSGIGKMWYNLQAFGFSIRCLRDKK